MYSLLTWLATCSADSFRSIITRNAVVAINNYAEREWSKHMERLIEECPSIDGMNADGTD
jgi:hypothetical protein